MTKKVLQNYASFGITSEFCSFHTFILKDTTVICGIIKFI